MYIPFQEEQLGGNPEDETKVLSEYHKFLKTIAQDKTTAGMEVLDIEKLQKATRDSRLVLDKYLLLFCPLDDPRTSPQRRDLYLRQEELMIALAEIEREEVEELEGELSSPAKPLEQDDTVLEIGRLKDLTDKQVKTFKAQNRAYLHKVFPELDEDISS